MFFSVETLFRFEETSEGLGRDSDGEDGRLKGMVDD